MRLCGATSAWEQGTHGATRSHCTLDHGHNGRHSWEAEREYSGRIIGAGHFAVDSEAALLALIRELSDGEQMVLDVHTNQGPAPLSGGLLATGEDDGV